MRVEFSPPDINADDIQAVVAALQSGWITTGPRTKQFEQALARWCGTAKVACLNSATAAMECALRLLDVGPGDEVITSAYTYTASASVICHVGATPVLVDVAAGTYQMDPQALARALSPRTKAIIPVDIGGVMENYDALLEVLNGLNHRRLYQPRSHTLQELFTRVPIVADAAHAFGATYHGQSSGAVADFSAFSFHAVKNLTTAEGGALTWRPGLGDAALDERLYHHLMLYSLHGQDKDALAKSAAGGWEYDVVAPLYKCNMTDINAALGLSQLQRYPALLARRQVLIDQYQQQLQAAAQRGGYQLDIMQHADQAGSRSSGHLMMVRLLGRDEAFRNELIRRMADRDVVCNVHFKPLPMLTAYSALGFAIGDFPQAFQQYQNEVTLPLHTLLSDADVQYVCESFDAAYRECQVG